MSSLFDWLHIPDPRESRRFLETHRELLSQNSEAILEQQRAKEATAPAPDSLEPNLSQQKTVPVQMVQNHLHLLQDIRLRGSTVDAIREAYVNLYGGFALDLPCWLEEKENQLQERGSEEKAYEQVPLLRDTIAQARQETDLAQEIRAELHRLLWHAYNDIPGELDTFIQQEQQACLETALHVFTLTRYPYQYARIQGNLGIAYRRGKAGDYQANLQAAVICYHRVLQVFTCDAFPLEYAKTHYNLGFAYYDQQVQGRRPFLEEAITDCTCALHVFTLEKYPTHCAATHSLLSLLYYERTQGTQRSNLETAIAHATEALRVYTEERFPSEYARLQRTLGNCYSEQLAIGETLNLEEAICCYTRALHVWTLDAFPEEYALIQYYLGIAYQSCLIEERREMLEKAIQCYKRALQVYTIDAYALQYAKAHIHLAKVYQDRVIGKRSENLEQANSYYNCALQVYLPGSFPQEYAIIQNNLGTIYSERLVGERRANLEEAIDCYHRALHLYPFEQFPQEYARTYYNLGLIYRERIQGERRANLEQALFCYSQALRGYTSAAFPQEYARIQLNLGVVYNERIEGKRMENIEEAIACCSRALQIFTRETFPLYYASLHNNLSNAYSERLTGERRTNIEQAIAYALQALEVYTREEHPTEYATIQLSLGNAFRERIEGENRANVEEAILHCRSALQIYTLERFPEQFAKVQNTLSVLYNDRLMGEGKRNKEEALNCCMRALQVFTREAFPKDYASAQHNLGTVYMGRAQGKRSTNLEEAITCFSRALQTYTREAFPRDYALTQNNLGNAYWMRIEGERKQNLEEAIACYQCTLDIFTFEAFPFDWARLQNNLGAVYSQRLVGDQAVNDEDALTCYRRALRVHTLEAFPREYRLTQLNSAFIEARRGRWEEAHRAYRAALDAEELLIALGAGAVGRDVILKEGREAAISGGFALVQLSRLAEAATVIERGRARGLAEAIAIDTAHPHRIRDPDRRTRYEDARGVFIQAQLDMQSHQATDLDSETRQYIDLEHTRIYEKAKARFDLIVEEIRQAQDPADFFTASVDADIILQAAESCGPNHALVYLAATPWGGFALTAFSSQPATQTKAHFDLLNLPDLTEEWISELIESRTEYNKESVIVGGFAWAQERRGLTLLPASSIAPGSFTFRDQAAFLHALCAGRTIDSMLDRAVQDLLRPAEFADSIDLPMHELTTSASTRLARGLETLFLRYELQRGLDILGKLAVHSLATWLQKKGIRSITLIPCGMLAAFPLSAIEVSPGKTFGDIFITSIIPNARLLLRNTQSASTMFPMPHTDVYTLGNPEPGNRPLPWGETEAFALASLARQHQMHAEAWIQQRATRRRLLYALNTGHVVDVSCHGIFNSEHPAESALLLARGEKLTLRDLFSGKAHLHGLRLLILSACQTAIIDQRGIRDEVYSIAMGMIQAGAAAALATLWPVDDRATCLLMVRFAQEWFPKMKQESPAAALARAQHWLRTCTYRELQTWSAKSIPLPQGKNLPSNQESVPVQVRPVEAAVRGERYPLSEAEQLLRTEASGQEHPDLCPYADPIYWAGFQVVGW
ncbi:MAG TPA: CHAT domain-containing protein [Ktedonobacteraceae bacterium]|nr:CHAT domain-containing protein [Ktedonobacteraceae bacterium]